ncbi:CocE/NonD family hydrolase [Mesorhizobium sp.]|uniref:CocE/NonD family hydrolase n=1 Tax=Mesorhizobium sp. TaxID=1871066 RepID=UPI000FE529AF|nr:CocE/NonD family hydrolase [Mesorhizobium sp.]RWI66018.1 MAG: CocE/NonD family hydrolase [Mesorhizobium sp.]TIN20356.1 MAG: CocE/NonD family hydrolase [Mesorhizobium sp.]
MSVSKECGASQLDSCSETGFDREQTQDSIFRLDLNGIAAGRSKLGPLESVYVTMRDGVRLAVDIVRPMGDDANTKRDTILVMTRYWRGIKGDPPHREAGRFVPHGYAVVVGDVRGTGASFGVWPYPCWREETLDFTEVLDWIVAQPWSTGRVLGYGSSYTANTAEWMAERNHPALKGIIPRFASYDPYEYVWLPSGIPAVSGARLWGSRSKNLDLNMLLSGDGERRPSPGVRPVGPGGAADLAEALRDHESVPPVWEGLEQVTFKDDRLAAWGGASMLDWSVMEAADRVSRSGAPIQNWASWFDAGTAQGAVRRFVGQSNPMNVIIGPWNHGGDSPWDPLRADGDAIPPTPPSQDANDVRFADLCFNGHAAREQGKILHYYTLGEGWKSTRVWPLPATRERWYMASGSRLSSSPDKPGFDSFQVDHALGEVPSNRWATSTGGAVKVDYGDRRQLDGVRLGYTSDPLNSELTITGHPVVHLNITSTREDGAFFVYLEAVKPDGVSCYLTEGQQRALHRKVWTDSPFSALGPQHSYLRRDAEPLIPGEPAILTFTLHPISARLPAGYRLRVCLAGSDKTTFANVPAHGAPPLLKFHRGAAGCYIDLPIIES